METHDPRMNPHAGDVALKISAARTNRRTVVRRTVDTVTYRTDKNVELRCSLKDWRERAADAKVSTGPAKIR